MSLNLNVTRLEKGPFVKLIFSIISDGKSASESVTQEININNLALVKLKFQNKHLPTSYHIDMPLPCSISLKKYYSLEKYTVKINILCERNRYSKEFLCTENWTDWIDMDKTFRICSNTHYTYLIAISVIKLEPKSFANFYEETDFCDFRLSTADGSESVAVHKLCLIAYSDTFKRMLSSKWKETEEGCIEIAEVTLQTLQNLKKYLYLGTLPDTEDDIYQLLLLARCYLIENLKEECIARLAREVKPENLQKLQEFAFDNKLPELMRAIAYFTPDETLKTAHSIEVRSKQEASSENDGK